MKKYSRMKSDLSHEGHRALTHGKAVPVKAKDQNKGDMGYLYHEKLKLTPSYSKPKPDKLAKR